jgi:hypothetical protein
MELNSVKTALDPAQFTPVTMTNSASGASADVQKTGAALLDFESSPLIATAR